MNREYIYWHSQRLNRKMEALVFGHAGRPVLVFPTSMGRFYQFEDFGMIQTLAGRIGAGEVQLFCVDSVDTESWYNRSVAPAARAQRHVDYENYILHEFLPYMRGRNANGAELMVTGCSFGAYHAVNLALRHPALVKRVVGLSGKYEVGHLMGSYYDDTIYFHSPIDFLPDLDDEGYLGPMRGHLEIALVAGENDICRDSTEELSRILHRKQIPHILDIWGERADHDWPWWRQMVLKFI